MTISVKARRLVDGKLVKELDDVSVSLYMPTSHSEITYVRLSIGDESVDKTDKNFLASIPVLHPHGFILDYSNWAAFLYLQLNPLSGGDVDLKLEFKSDIAVHARGCRVVETYGFVGQYVFRIESKIGDYFVIVDGPDGIDAPSRVIPNATMLKYPFKDFAGRKNVYYNDRGISVMPKTDLETARVRDRAYSIDFTNRMGPKSLSYIFHVGLKKVLFGGHKEGEMDFDPAPSWDIIDRSRSSMKFSQLNHRSIIHHVIGEFEYFESVDGKLRFTLHAHPYDKMFKTFNAYVKSREDDDSDQMIELRAKYAEFADRWAQNSATWNDIKVPLLNEFIDLFQRIKI
jgi:hypothetical protein